MNWNEFNEYFMDMKDMPFLWLITILVMLIIGLKLFKDSNIDGILETTKKYLRANAFFIIFYLITRIFFLFSNFYPETEPLQYQDLNQFQILIRAAYFFALIGLAILIYGIETTFFKTKGKIAAIPTITIIIIMFLDYDIFRIVTYVVQFIVVFIIMGLYVYVYKKGAGELRKTALTNIIGLIFIIISVSFDSIVGKELLTDFGLRWIAYILSPFLFIIGIVLLYKAWTQQVRSL